MTFNIRKLKIQIRSTENKLRICDPRSRDRLRAKLKAQEFALLMARQARAAQRLVA